MPQLCEARPRSGVVASDGPRLPLEVRTAKAKQAWIEAVRLDAILGPAACHCQLSGAALLHCLRMFVSLCVGQQGWG